MDNMWWYIGIAIFALIGIIPYVVRFFFPPEWEKPQRINYYVNKPVVGAYVEIDKITGERTITYVEKWHTIGEETFNELKKRVEG